MDLVRCFHSCITMHGFMNVSNKFCASSWWNLSFHIRNVYLVARRLLDSRQALSSLYSNSAITKISQPINCKILIIFDTRFKYYLHFRRLKFCTAHNKIHVAYLFLVQSFDETEAVSMLSRTTSDEYVLETVKKIPILLDDSKNPVSGKLFLEIIIKI